MTTPCSPAAAPTSSSRPSRDPRRRPARHHHRPSESAPPELEPQVDGVMIQVLNGTSEVGLAAQVEELLGGQGVRGHAALPAADAAQKPVETTIVYFRTGDDAEQNEVDADHLATRFLKGVEARSSPSARRSVPTSHRRRSSWC